MSLPRFGRVGGCVDRTDRVNRRNGSNDSGGKVTTRVATARGRPFA